MTRIRRLPIDLLDQGHVNRLEGMLRKAIQVGEQAEHDGKLRQLPAGRFARAATTFETRKKGGV